MKRRLATFAIPIALALMAPTPTAMATTKTCVADDCKIDCIVRCVQGGGDYGYLSGH